MWFDVLRGVGAIPFVVTPPAMDSVRHALETVIVPERPLTIRAVRSSNVPKAPSASTTLRTRARIVVWAPAFA